MYSYDVTKRNSYGYGKNYANRVFYSNSISLVQTTVGVWSIHQGWRTST